MEPLTSSAVPVRSNDVVYFHHGGQTYMHHGLSGEFFVLNAAGGEAWELCDGALDVGRIAEQLTNTFDVEKDDVVHDVLALVDNLYHADCVRLVWPTMPASITRTSERTTKERAKGSPGTYERPLLSMIELTPEGWLP